MNTALMILSCWVSASPASYSEARQESIDSGRPLVVLVSADWCPHCVTMKRDVMPQVLAQNPTPAVVFTILDADEHPQLAKKLMQGRSLPQLVVYSKNPDANWKRYRLVGTQSTTAVRSFIGRGLR